MKIKTLRRIETELDNEMVFIAQRLSREENQITKAEAEKVGENACVKAGIAFNRLVSAKFEIRELVASFNQENGINTKTAEIAKIEAVKAFIENNLLRMGKSRLTRNYQTDVHEYTQGISDGQEDFLRAEVRLATRKIQSLKDSCNGINSQGDIQISDSLLSVFKDYSLVD